jgi:hypothetical protein
LVAGELAVDLTNKRLYTEDSGGTVLELGTNPASNVTFGDNTKAIFGAGSDLQIYHDGSNSYVKDAGTGDLILNVNNFRLKNAADSEIYLYAQDGGGVNLYHTGNAIKLATTATGISVTGTVTADNAHVPSSGSYEVGGTASGTTAIGSLSNSAGKLALDTDSTRSIHLKTGGNLRQFIDGATGDISFYNDAAAQGLFWDSSASALGLGNTSPIAALDVTGTDAVGSLTSLADTVTRAAAIIRGSNHANGYGLYMGYGNSSTDAQYIQATLKTGSQAYPLLLNPYGGNVLVGQSTADSTSNGHGLLATGRAYHTMSSAHPLQLNRKSNNGDIAVFQKDGTTVGSIGVEGGDSLYMQGGTTSGSGLHFHATTSDITPLRNGARIDNAIDLGSTANRFKDLYLSGGVYLGGTGAANKLDDYEEGTWTPTVTSSAGTITTVTSEIGTYTKIGRLVTLQYQFNIATLGTASGNCIVSGMPFTEDNTEITYYAGVHRARSGASSITEFDPAGTLQLYGTTPVAGVYLGSMVYNTTS